MLCFINSVAEVHQCCQLIDQLTNHTIKTYPLVQSQTAPQQKNFVENGRVFFSTTVAETSLTFPSLRYVIDTGVINTPVYDLESSRTVLRKLEAAQSMVKQCLGRLGRTAPGEYHYLYDIKLDQSSHPTPQICQTDLTTIELSLRRSIIGQGLDYFNHFLPNKLHQKAIDKAVNELRR